MKINCFKAYDVRGRIPDELNPDIAYRIGNATAVYLEAKEVVLGHDIRRSSEELAAAVACGLTDAGADVLDIGLGGTEMVYFGTGHLGADGGIMVTASHNPADYNGLKFVRRESRPVSIDTGLSDIRVIAQGDGRKISAEKGSIVKMDIFDDYLVKLLDYVDVARLKPLKIVVNAGNGGAGLIVDRLEAFLPFEFIKVHHEPNGDFPNGVPNPMLEENRSVTIDAIRTNAADFGIAWDGDFDRCFFFDGTGRFIEGYYMVSLLAESQLAQSPGAAVVYDPRLVWNTLDTVRNSGGRPVQSKSGHSFIKDVLRREDAIYGGEMSAHHYFREFFYCDSGMIPWLLVASIVSDSGQSLASLVDGCMSRYPSSGEINRQVPDTDAAIELLDRRYRNAALSVDETDGISMEFDRWRFNLRASNTEPVIRLNVESRADPQLMKIKTDELLEELDTLG